jgi:hypothetical protein
VVAGQGERGSQGTVPAPAAAADLGRASFFLLMEANRKRQRVYYDRGGPRAAGAGAGAVAADAAAKLARAYGLYFQMVCIS